jgi:voltage-gated potassium channel
LADRLTSFLITLRHKIAAVWVGTLLAIGLVTTTLATEPAIWSHTAMLLRAVMLAAHAALGWQIVSRARAALHAPYGMEGYFWSVEGTVDVLSLLAVPALLIAGVGEPLAWLGSLVWTLKLATASHAVPLLLRVFALEARPLSGVAAIFLIILGFSGTTLFLLERGAQPDEFDTLPKALWWAVTTLTTTGYGDAVPHSGAGRVVAAFVMISGLALFGLFAGILATGFAAEGRRRDFLRAWDVIDHVPFFHGMNAAATAQLARALRRIDVPQGSVIFRRGRAGDCMYFIVDGEVRADVGAQPVRIGKGGFFGELALLSSGVRSGTVMATKPTTLLMLDIADFRMLAANHPDLAEAVEAEARRRGGQRHGTVTIGAETLERRS